MHDLTQPALHIPCLLVLLTTCRAAKGLRSLDQVVDHGKISQHRDATAGVAGVGAVAGVVQRRPNAKVVHPERSIVLRVTIGLVAGELTSGITEATVGVRPVHQRLNEIHIRAALPSDVAVACCARAVHRRNVRREAVGHLAVVRQPPAAPSRGARDRIPADERRRSGRSAFALKLCSDVWHHRLVIYRELCHLVRVIEHCFHDRLHFGAEFLTFGLTERTDCCRRWHGGR